MKKQLIFSLDKAQVLNSNTYKSLHWAVKGKKTEYLRVASINEGVLHHNANNLPAVENQLTFINELTNQAIAKSRRTKILKKEGFDVKEIKKLVAEEFKQEEIVRVGESPELLFDKFTVLVTVFPPTRRRLDPINLYPTVKAIIDGLTDSAWWEDDNHNHLLQIGFRYGGLSEEKDTFKLILDVEEVEEADLVFYKFNEPKVKP